MIRHFYYLKWLALFFAILVLLPTPSKQNDVQQLDSTQNVGQCFKKASTKYGVSERYLRAIAWAESKFQPDTMHKNANGSFDAGIMQINSIHLTWLEKEGISKNDLIDPCTNIDVGARIYAMKVSRHGDTWKAIGAYNSENTVHHERYVNRIKKALKEMPEFDV